LAAAEFVQRRPVPVDRLKIRLWPRDQDVVERRGIERLVAAESQIGPAGSDQGLDFGQDEPLRDRRRDGDHIGGKPVALGDVEDGEALQQRYRVRFVALLTCAGALLVGDEPVGEHDRVATLASASRTRPSITPRSSPSSNRAPCGD